MVKRIHTPPPMPPLDIPRGPAGIGPSAPLWLIALALTVCLIFLIVRILGGGHLLWS